MKRRDVVAVMVTGVVVVLGLLTVFAIEITNTQAKSKADVENRVHERSVLAAALIDSLFQTSAVSSIPVDTRLYGGNRVPGRLLNRAAGANRYAVLLEPSGRIIARSRGFNDQAVADLRPFGSPAPLADGPPVGAGQRAALREIGVINFGLTLKTRAGVRYLLTGSDPEEPRSLPDRRAAPDSRCARSPQLRPRRQRRGSGLDQPHPAHRIHVSHPDPALGPAPHKRGGKPSLLRPGATDQHELADAPHRPRRPPVRQCVRVPQVAALGDLSCLRHRRGSRPHVGPARPAGQRCRP